MLTAVVDSDNDDCASFKLFAIHLINEVKNLIFFHNFSGLNYLLSILFTLFHAKRCSYLQRIVSNFNYSENNEMFLRHVREATWMNIGIVAYL